VKKAILLALAACALLGAQSAWLVNTPARKPDVTPQGATLKPTDNAVKEVNPKSLRRTTHATAHPRRVESGLEAVQMKSRLAVPAPTLTGTDDVDSLFLDGPPYYAWHISPHTFYTAVRFTPAINCTLTAVKFYTYNAAVGYDSVYVFDESTATQPGAVLASARWTYGGNQWNTITLPTPVYVPAGRDVWTCVRFVTNENVACATTDAGPMVETREYISTDRTTWYDNLSGLGLDANWSQRAIITPVRVVDDMSAWSIDGLYSPWLTDQWLTIRATVVNQGSNQQPAGVPVKLRITGDNLASPYEDLDQVTLTALDPGHGEQVTFTPNWRTPSTAGICTLEVWTDLSGDADRANDTARYYLDVSPWLTYANWGAPAMWYTGDTTERATWFFPANFDLNYPFTIESLATAFFWDDGDPWDDSTYRFQIYAGDLSTVLYTSEDLEAQDGMNKVALSSPLTISSGSFAVAVIPVSASGAPWSLADRNFYYHSIVKQGGVWYYWGYGEFLNAVCVNRAVPDDDVGFIRVSAPFKSTEPGVAVTPMGTVRNYGINDEIAAPCSLYVLDTLSQRIFATYTTVNVPAGETAQAVFPDWTPPAGDYTYTLQMATFLSSDGNATNDSAMHTVYVFHVSDSLIAPTQVSGVSVRIDGNITAGEWWDANRYDVSNVFGRNDPYFYYAPNNVWLYLKHDTSRLYGAVDLTFIEADESTEVGLYFDENNDHAWSADSSEGNYWFEHFPRVYPTDSIVYRALMPSGGSWRTRARGARSRTGFDSGHQQYEFSIPLGAPKCSLNLNPAGDTCGFWLYATDDKYGMTRGWWKTTMADNGGYVVPPENYGHLFLAGTTVPTLDMGVLAMVAPVGTIDTAATVAPRSTLKNFGTESATFESWFFIDSAGQRFYSDYYSATLAGGDTVTHTYAAWAKPHPSRRYVTRCSTYVAGDVNASNDKLDGAFTVAMFDVGVQDMVSPVGWLDTSAVIAPQAVLKNFGTTDATFQTWFFMDSAGRRFYTDTYSATLAPGGTVTHTYATWAKPHRSRRYVTRCSTYVAGDVNAANDKLDSAFTIAVFDVGVQSIVGPTGPLDSSAVITPRAKLRNFGTAGTLFQTWFFIDSAGQRFYTDTYIASLNAGDTVTHTYAEWVKPHPARSYVTRCSTYLVGDVNPANDRVDGAFTITLAPPPDVAATAVLVPIGSPDTTQTITPTATYNNNGPGVATFTAVFQMDSGATHTVLYNEDSLIAGFAPGAMTITFPTWAKPHPVGTYNILCSVYCAVDTHHVNDALRISFSVVLPGTGPAAWTRMANLLPGSRNKNIKDGGALAYGKEGTDANDTGYVYGFKGNNRYEFYRYNTRTDIWVTRESIPARNRNSKKKAVKKGSSLAMGTNGKIYATKGNGTLDLWQYDPVARVWSQKADVPAGGKTCKEGTSTAAVYVDGADYVYLLKGSATFEFYRYNADTDAWDTSLPVAPAGTTGKPYKNGSSIAFDGGDTIYCLKGSYNNDFAAYSISGKAWVTRDPLPLTGSSGRRKKVKAGGSMAAATGAIYALKGGNTNEFYQYKTTDHKWYIMADMPTTLRRVNGGGALVAAKDVSALYAFRGNNTLELWKYGPVLIGGAMFAPGGEQKEIQAGAVVRNPEFGLFIAPNPFTAATAVSYSLPRAGDVSLRLYDVTGTLVSVLARGQTAAGTHGVDLDASHLAKGIYVLKYEANGYSTTEKLIIE
jgi:hypothetical protein